MSSPLDERTVGNAPYEEALAKAQARNLRGGNISFRNIVGRMLQRGALQAALAGLGSVPRGANFGTAFLAGAGGAARAQAALDQQASLDQYRAQQQAMAEQKATAEKPMPPPDPLLDLKREHLQARIDSERARAEQLRAPKPPKTGRPAAAPKAPKPPKVPRRIPHGTTEGAILRNIQGSTDETALAELAAGFAEADSPAIRQAALDRLRAVRQPPTTAFPNRRMSLGQ